MTLDPTKERCILYKSDDAYHIEFSMKGRFVTFIMSPPELKELGDAIVAIQEMPSGQKRTILYDRD